MNWTKLKCLYLFRKTHFFFQGPLPHSVGTRQFWNTLYIYFNNSMGKYWFIKFDQNIRWIYKCYLKIKKNWASHFHFNGIKNSYQLKQNLGNNQTYSYKIFLLVHYVTCGKNEHWGTTIAICILIDFSQLMSSNGTFSQYVKKKVLTYFNQDLNLEPIQYSNVINMYSNYIFFTSN
jgi:hypothetical protein